MSNETGKEKVEIIPARPYFYNSAKVCLAICILSAVLCFIFLYLRNAKDLEGLLLTIQNLAMSIPNNIFIPFLFSPLFLLLVYILLKATKAKKVKFDPWIVDYAYKRLGSAVIYYTPKILLIEYDRTTQYKDLKKFVDEISNNSNYYTYYFQDPDIDQGILPVTPTKKKPLPTLASLNTSDDTNWNIIPIGEAVNHSLRKVTPIGWWLNDETKRSDIIQTIPSSHLLVAGGTGSGKSVLQNCIIGHISRFSSQFQLFLCDVKKVEFGPLKNVKSVKKVGITMEEIENIVVSVRQIMNERFAMMEKYKVNNVYKLKNKKVPTIILNGKEYQEDEIFNCRVNGVEMLMTARSIYDKINSPLSEDSEGFGNEKNSGFNSLGRSF